MAPRQGWRSSSVWTLTATTTCTPRGQSCFAAWDDATRRYVHSTVRSSSCTMTRKDGCWSSAGPIWPGNVRPVTLDLLADGSLAGRFWRCWSERPAWPQLRDVDGRWLSSDELEDQSRRAAGRLLAGGLEPGQRLIISAAPSAALVIWHLAALRAGLVAVPVNPGYTEHEVARIVRAAEPAAGIVDDPERARWIGEHGIPVHGLELDNSEPDPSGLDRSGPGDPALLVFTSGTTGEPKGALLSHGNLLSSATAVGEAWRWEPEERLLLTLPLFHVHGLGVGVIGSLCAGGSIILRPRFDPADVAA